MLFAHKLIVESEPETDNKSEDPSEDESDVDVCSNERKKDKKQRDSKFS